MSDLYQTAKKAAEEMDVSTPPDSIVLYSISFLPTTQNRDKAFEYVKKNPGKQTIEQTACGKCLIELGLYNKPYFLPSEQVAEIWGIASRRFIAGAGGNVTAFVEQADARSVFRRFELPALLNNPRLSSINGMNKFEFAQIFQNTAQNL